MINPFEHTQAKDLSDDEIRNMWVELPANGFVDMVRPHSSMPLLLLGSKGSGKTHLLRYASFSLQVMRSPGRTAAECIAEEGYVGIYMSCQGLNASRFHGRGFTPDQWRNVFPTYFDLWLVETALPVFGSILEGVDASQAADVVGEYAAFCGVEATTIKELRESIASTRRELDRAVHSAGSRSELAVTTPWNWGELVFGLPAILTRRVDSLKRIRIIYLIDEFESLLEGHQLYVNTLIRERFAPVTFRVGGRLHGVRTYRTLSAGEALRVGSEYERINVDERLRKSRGAYRHFAADLVSKRLAQFSPATGSIKAHEAASLYRGAAGGLLASEDARSIVGTVPSDQREHMLRLRSNLQRFGRAPTGRYISAPEVDQVVRRLSVPEEPLLEKAAVLMFYRRWAGGAALIQSADDISTEIERALAGDASVGVMRQLKHFGKDLLAQLYRENHRQIDYSGFNTLVGMSMGIPRHFLMILKHVHAWATFLGEDPYVNPISRRAQNEGSREAAEWFFEDSKLTTGVPKEVHFAIERVATLLREVRFSAKPSECSPSGISLDQTKLTSNAIEVIDAAVEVSLLIRSNRGQRDRNSQRIDNKYRLNYMLCPRWDLPIASRGVLPLSPDLASAVFDPEFGNEFERLMFERIRQMSAPFADVTMTRDQIPLDLH